MTSEELINTLEKLDLKPRAYAARGMYGVECVGVSVTHLGDQILPIGWKYDTLGYRYIVYWPNTTWPEKNVHVPYPKDRP